jgi:hypothetical protein
MKELSIRDYAEVARHVRGLQHLAVIKQAWEEWQLESDYHEVGYLPIYGAFMIQLGRHLGAIEQYRKHYRDFSCY